MATHDFDTARREREERERTFTLAGQTFGYRPGVAPEVLTEWEDAQAQGLSGAETLVSMDKLIVSFLDPGQEEKWRAVRSQDLANPVTLSDITEVVKFLVRENSGRPTESPSGSPPSDGATTTSSTDESPSPAVAA